MIEYESPNGYKGVLYGKSSISIYNADGLEVLHTRSRSVNTPEELKECIDDFPQFYETLLNLNKEEKENGN